MGGLVWHYVNVAQALWRTVTAVRNPAILPKRLDQLLGTFFGINHKMTISRWARRNDHYLYTRPIVWLTQPFDRGHIWEIDDARPYHDGPGFGWALLGNTIAAICFAVFL